MRLSSSIFAGFAFGLAFMISCAFDTEKSRERAQMFSDQAGFSVKNIVCQAYDTDENGYVSCTVFRNDAEPYSLECPASHHGCMANEDCRPASTKMN